MSKLLASAKFNLSGGATSDQLVKTVSYYLAFVALGLVNASLGPTLPGLAENTRTPLSEIGFLFTAHSLGYLIGSLSGGRLYDRVSGHRVMGATILGITTMTFLVPLMPQLWMLTIVLLFLGSAQGALDVGGNTLLVWVHKEKVGPFMNALHFFFGVGAFLAPIIVAQAFLRGGGILGAYWVLGILVFPIAIWFLRLPSPPVRTTTDNEAAGPLNYPLITLIVLFFFLYVGAEVGFGGWIFTYALETNLANEAGAASLNAAFWGALTVGRLLAIPIAIRLRPRTILIGDLVGALISITILILWPGSLLITWIATIGLGLSLASPFPMMLSWAERRLAISGQITSWFFVGASLGAMTWPLLIGQLFEGVGPWTMMVTIMVALFLTLIVILVLTLTYPPSEKVQEAITQR